MDVRYLEVNQNLRQAYKSWLSEIEEKTPKFLEDRYSNPYYCCVPKGWLDSQVRILLVGEEGFGSWGRGKADGISAEDINMGQTICWSSLASYLNYPLKYDLYPEAWHFNYHRSAFWLRARKLSTCGICAWTNIDLVHVRSDQNGHCSLSEDERKLLHSVETKMLAKQIEILKPTHVVYAGWYEISLKHELPEVFQKLYPGGIGDSSLWSKRVVTIKDNKIYHIFAYHPNWGCRQKGYENLVMEEFRKSL